MASTRYPQRVRNDLRFRELTVLRVERASAGFQRIVLGGERWRALAPAVSTTIPKSFSRPRGGVCAAGGHR
jgi:NADPH-dependent ferric siderophore reductase